MASLRNNTTEPRLVATGETLETFRDDVRYLWCSDNIAVYEEPPSALEFLRNHVAVSRPCIIRNSIVVRPDPSDAAVVPLQMTLDDLVRWFPAVAANTEEGSLPPLSVDVTPDGHGDCLRRVAIDDGALEEEKVFVKPLERSMGISDFCKRLRRGRTKQQQDQGQQHPIDDRGNLLDKVFPASSDTDDETDKSGEDDDDFFEDCVLYYSRQNDCLREELSPLWNLKQPSKNEDGVGSHVFPRSFPWAEEAFFGQRSGAPDSATSTEGGPDAVNLWMGDERAVSAMHKDHYENLFYVLSGEKVFGLCPPSDAPYLYEREVLGGRFRVSKTSDNETPEREWSVELDREEDDTDQSSSGGEQPYSRVHWIAIDLFGNGGASSRSERRSEEFPLARYANPVTVRVKAGELLYLPSLWFHRVSQTCETIGINYWYDMNFESPLWCYFHFLQQLRSSRKEHEQQQRRRP